MHIIARYNEDISWANDIEKFVVQKDEHLPNIGRETSSYFWYIINNYESLSGEYTFVQGRKQDHPVHVFDHNCDLNGSPHHPGLNLKELANDLGIEIPDQIQFTRGAQFTVSAEQIKKRELEWYKKAYDIAMLDDGTCGSYPYRFERLWKYIFNL